MFAAPYSLMLQCLPIGAIQNTVRPSVSLTFPSLFFVTPHINLHVFHLLDKHMHRLMRPRNVTFDISAVCSAGVEADDMSCVLNSYVS